MKLFPYLFAVIKVIEVLKDTEVEEEGNIHLTCKLNADVDITWGKNGQKLSRNMQTYFNKTVADNSFMYTLTIKNAKEENSGEYSFVYENLKTSCHVIVKVGHFCINVRKNKIDRQKYL